VLLRAFPNDLEARELTADYLVRTVLDQLAERDATIERLTAERDSARRERDQVLRDEAVTIEERDALREQRDASDRGDDD
jgi:hypothetical protein